uniref:Uncharacterized protein n=1 Tax=Arundo donax TaxID=35708 RepID=A0A0A9H513_ARUDO
MLMNIYAPVQYILSSTLVKLKFHGVNVKVPLNICRSSNTLI